MEVRGEKDYLHYLDSVTGELVKKFITKEDRIELLNSLIKFPGEMQLDERVFLARTEAQTFETNGQYCNKVPYSGDYIDYWDTQKSLTYTGLLIDNEYYITGDYYWYLNFMEITWKEGIISFPQIRDSDMWFYQLIELAALRGEFTVTSKVRQWGFSLKLLSRILKRFWFEPKFRGKLIASSEDYLDSNWNTLEGYRDFLNEHTAWGRNLDPSKKGNWQQRVQMEDKSYRGLFSTMKTINNKNKASAVVSGFTSEAFIDEAGVSKNLVESLGLLAPALSKGNIVMGQINIGGAAGNIAESKDLKTLMYNPAAYNMLALPNVWDNKPNQEVGIFIPAYYNYGDCSDDFGNSLIDEAKKAIKAEEEKRKEQSHEAYQIFKSQYPQTIEDMFRVRLENIFPAHIVEPHYDWLNQNYKPTTVELTRNRDTSISHTLSDKYAVVKDFPVKKSTVRHGAICVVEPPMSNPPFGLYYAGVDTITPISTRSSISLQSIHIYKASHHIDEEYSEDKLVAWYTGRCDNPERTFEITLELIEWYNARACIENNNRNFIQWMIGKKKTTYMMKKNQMPIIKDMVVRSSFDTSDYGITMTAQFKKDLFATLVEYCKEEIGVEFKEDGTEVPIYGITRIKDEMVLREMLDFNPHPKFNCDRLISFALAIFAAKSNTSRGLMVKSASNKVKKHVNYSRELMSTQLRKGSFSSFNTKLGF